MGTQISPHTTLRCRPSGNAHVTLKDANADSFTRDPRETEYKRDVPEFTMNYQNYSTSQVSFSYRKSGLYMLTHEIYVFF